MASSEWPNAMMMATNGMEGHTVPCSQPSPSLLKCRFGAVGGGGNWAGPLTSRVMTDHPIIRKTMAAVTCMMRRALVEDSWMPRMLARQKKMLTATPKVAANRFWGMWNPEPIAVEM